MFFDTKESFKQAFVETLRSNYGKSIEQATDVEKFLTLASLVKAHANSNVYKTNTYLEKQAAKKMYYFSLEFLLGRLLTNNLMNLGLYKVVQEGLADFGIDLNTLEDIESDAGLGNGGLGRLAACFLDSLATLHLPGNGNTIRYQYGLFKQLIANNEQVEVPDQWLRYGNAWETRHPDEAVKVKFYGDVRITMNYETGRLNFEHVNAQEVLAVPYDMPVVGADTKCTNVLRMWSAEASDNFPADQDFIKYLNSINKICLNVYPDDSTVEGKYIRIKQEYFFIAAGLGSIVREHLKQNPNLDNFAEKVCIQLNDTHPAMSVAELMRIFLDEYNYEWDKAWSIVSKVFAYTNHTVMQEALEKWPVEYIRTLLPRVYTIIEEINRRFREAVYNQSHDRDLVERTAIIQDNQVKMAHLSIVGSFSVNGVAKLHSKILVEDLFRDFFNLMPEKFNNKTNGITQRRWLLYSNPELTNLLEKTIGPEFKHDFTQIEKLEQYIDDKKLQEAFLKVKYQRKLALCRFLKDNYQIEVDPNSIFDTQAKRLHAYKRQLLNILHVIYLYQRIKQYPTFTMPKTTFLFGAKAAPAYVLAKKIIKLINCVAEKVDNDPVASKFIKVVFIPNYRVTVAEYLMNASDVSEQISTAGKEASGTGNMKFMMNGAITLGTLDGANVEISERVGLENCEIFGLKANEIENMRSTYSSVDYYKQDARIKQAVDSLLDGTFSSVQDDFIDIYNDLIIRNDEYFVLADFAAYVKAHEHINALYSDRSAWARLCLLNIAKSAYFSSDRTILDYVRDVWHIEAIDNSKLK